MIDGCNHLGELVKSEILSLEKKHIPKKDLSEYITLHYVVMERLRRNFCGYKCPEKYNCINAAQYLPKLLPESFEQKEVYEQPPIKTGPWGNAPSKGRRSGIGFGNE